MPDVRFTANDYSSYAGILNALEEYDGEVMAWQKAIEANPEKVELLKNLATAYSQAGSRALKAQKAAGDDAEAAAAAAAEAHQAYVNAAAAYQRYIDADQYVTNDLVELGSRYQNVAATAEPGSDEKAEAIGKAIAAIDIVIERVPDNFIPYRNKARMLLVKNDNQPAEEVVQAYTKMLELLDADPENLNKRSDVYREAYSQIASYYISQKDTDSAKTWYLKMLELDPDNQALRDYIDKLK